MTYHYQPYRASNLAKELWAKSQAATPAPWSAVRCQVPEAAADALEAYHDRDPDPRELEELLEARVVMARVDATLIRRGVNREKTRQGVICGTVDMAGRHAEDIDNDMLLIEFLRNNADTLVSMLERLEQLESTFESAVIT